MEDKKKLKELAKQLLELADDKDCEWFDRDELSQDDIDKIKELGNDQDEGALVFRILWCILKELKELRREVRLNGTPIEPLTEPLTEPIIQPYTPYVPYPNIPSAPNPWQVWYGSPTYSSPGTGDLFGPVTCTYTDTEGHEFIIDPTVPATITCTYQVGTGCECNNYKCLNKKPNPFEQ